MLEALNHLDLTKEELSLLLRLPSKDNVVFPFNSKEFQDYAKGYQVKNLPEERIVSFYYKEVIERGNINLKKHFERIIKPAVITFLEELKKTFVEDELLQDSLVIDAIDFKQGVQQLCVVFYPEFIEVLFKVTGFKLNDIQKLIIKNQVEKVNELKSLEKHLREELSSNYANELAEKILNEKQKAEEKLRKEISRVETSYQQKNNNLKQRMQVLENTNKSLEQAIKHTEIKYINKEEEQSKQIADLKKEVEKANKKYSQSLKALNEQKVLNQRIQEDVEKYSKLLDLRHFDTKDIAKLVHEIQFDTQSIKEKFKLQFKDLSSNNLVEKINLSNEWQTWVNNEKQGVENILSKCLHKAELTREDLELLDDVSYSLQFRFLVVKLITHLGYRYLASEYWQELFA